MSRMKQHESRWAAIVSISSKIGCAPQTLNEWVKKVEIDTGQRGGISTEQAEKMKALEREVRELKQANEILRNGNIPPEDAEANFCAAHERCKRWGGRPPGGIKCAKVVGVETFYEESVHERG